MNNAAAQIKDDSESGVAHAPKKTGEGDNDQDNNDKSTRQCLINKIMDGKPIKQFGDHRCHCYD